MSFFLAAICAERPSQAAEHGLGSYLLGLTIPMAGYTPPPGIYFSDTVYFYQGSANPSLSLPFGRAIAAGLSEQFLLNIATLSALTDAQFLGGTFGVAATVPFGRTKVSADVALLGGCERSTAPTPSPALAIPPLVRSSAGSQASITGT